MGEEDFKEIEKVANDKVSTKEMLIDWLVYSTVSLVCLIAFFYNEPYKLISASVLVGFLFGLINRVIRELVFIKRKLK